MPEQQLGLLLAPLVGALANGTPVPMAAVVLGASALALVLMLTSRRRLDEVSYD